MPFYSYRCRGCDALFETLVTASEVPACPSCGSQDLERQLSQAVGGESKLKEIRSVARRQAAREGHLSNYSRAELKRG